MKLKRSEFKRLVKKLVLEVLIENKKLEELTATSSIDGYQTPFAFSKARTEKEHIKNMKSNAEVFDYETSDEEKNNTISMNEGKSLYHLFRDHSDLSPSQKVGVTVREINKLMTEIEKLINVSTRFKSEKQVNSSALWKTTNRYLEKLDEKIKRIAYKLKELK